MARFRQYANESQIRNLTNNTYRVYCSTGCILEIKPTIYSDKFPEDSIYIASTGTRDWLIEHGVDKRKIFFAACNGTDRSKKLVWALYPYCVEDPRLVIHRES